MQEGFYMDKDTIEKFSAFMDENRGKRKFSQSVDVVVNFTGIDMAKQDNRLNLEIKMPHPKGKSHNVIVFADDKNIASKATSDRKGARTVFGSKEQDAEAAHRDGGRQGC
jgi:ribosomal protein L1